MTTPILWVDSDAETARAAVNLEETVRMALGHEEDLFPFYIKLHHTAEEALADSTPYRALIIEPSPLWQACKEAHNPPPTEPGQPKLYDIPTHQLMRNFRNDGKTVIVYSTLELGLFTDAGVQDNEDYTNFVAKPDSLNELPDLIYSIVTGIDG